jgi:hypothetical protein
MIQKFNEILQDSSGRILGTVETRKRPLNKRERDVCEKFVAHFYEINRKESMSKQAVNMKANVVGVAGTIKKLTVDPDEGRGFLLLEAGPEGNKFIPATVFKDADVLEKLGSFQEGDYIQVRGHIRAWSQKKDDAWVNKLEVRVESISNEAPKRESKPAPKKSSNSSEDFIPF